MRKLHRGFTLMEVLLSLALAAVVAGLIGGLVQMYLINQDRGQDNVKQAQLARSILNMIAEDIRTTVRFQQFDTSGMQSLLGGGGSAGGGGAGSNAGGGGAPASSAPSAPSSSDMSASSTELAPLPPGIYGTETSIEIDVSRLPRPDEYFPLLADVSTGAMGDMPSDIRTVSYYVQSPGTTGVQDPLAPLLLQASQDSSGASIANGGLVRRSLDRAVTQYAYEIGTSDQLLRTGQLIAPEVVAISFEYFDGTTWQVQWDSSQQSLPMVVKISIALQRESFARSNPYTQGGSIASLTSDLLQEYGIDVFSVNTIIPGAQLLVAPTGATGSGSTDNGMGAMGL
jgi:prepilin-type N-terminal cleavage/methylation domain-containing protein